MDSSRDDLIYFAAAIDCEGSISCVSDKAYPGVHLGNNYKPLYDMLSAAFGGEVARGSGRNRNCWRWGIVGRDIIEPLALMLPYFRIKRKQALLAIKLANLITNQGLKIPDDVFLLRHVLAEKIAELNKGDYPWNSV